MDNSSHLDDLPVGLIGAQITLFVVESTNLILECSSILIKKRFSDWGDSFQIEDHQEKMCYLRRAMLSPYFKQFQAGEKPGVLHSRQPPGPVITLSHQSGAGAHEIGELMVGLLQTAESDQPWKVFDRDLVEKVLADHDLPTDFAKFMPEDRRFFIQDVVEELVGLRPPSWVMIPRIAKTVIRLAGVGHVVLVGRGTSFITARMSNVFHVRLIASLQKRSERVQRLNHLAPAEAAKFIRKEDSARARYVKAHFHVRIEDDLLYDLIINTDRVADPVAARMIVDASLNFFEEKEAGSNIP